MSLVDKIIHMDVEIPPSQLWIEIDDGIYINAQSGRVMPAKNIINNPPTSKMFILTKQEIEELKRHKSSGSSIG